MKLFSLVLIFLVIVAGISCQRNGRPERRSFMDSFSRGRGRENGRRRQMRLERDECEELKRLEERFGAHFEKRFGEKLTLSEDCNSEDDWFAENWKKHRLDDEEHNRRFNEGNETYKKGVNEHSILDFEEVKAFRMGLMERPSGRSLPVAPVVGASPQLPDQIDWRDGNGMSPVKDQGLCGSCWAFSVTSVIEWLMRHYNSQKLLSEQHLVDCDSSNNGCDGGWPTDAFEYIQQNGLSGSTYDYEDREGSCRKSLHKLVVKIGKSCEERLGGNEERLKEIVATRGPVVVAVCATENLSEYSAGIFTDSCDCRVNHAMVVTGYGTDPSFGDFWWVRNSWGESWGAEYGGYMKMARGRNMCRIADYAMYLC